MSLALYMDENVHEAITHGLRERGVDVLTVQEDGRRHRPDAELIDRATALGRVAVSEDADFLAEAVRRQRAEEHFSGIIRSPQGLGIGICVEDLELIAKACDLEEYTERIEYLPL